MKFISLRSASSSSIVGIVNIEENNANVPDHK